MNLKIAVNGAAGRMGQRVVALVDADTDLELVAALDSPAHPRFGEDAGEVAGLGTLGLSIDEELPLGVDAVIDFSTPAGLLTIGAACAERRVPLIAATTGLTDSERDEVLGFAQTTPLILAPNMSLAVNLVMKLVGDAARSLRQVDSGVDVEIIERHHRYKEDAPSGTALKFGEIVADEMGQTEHVHGRHGRPGQRPVTEIGYHALRTGDNVGEHTIVFGLLGETIDLTVRGHTRDSYAHGALLAAKYLTTREPGEYTMADVLGLG